MAAKPQKTKVDEGEVSPSNPKRLNINMSQRDWDRLKKIEAMMEAENTTMAVKDALRLLEYFLKQHGEGTQFFKKTADGDMIMIEMFGIAA